MNLILFFRAVTVLFFLSTTCIAESAQEENPFYEHIRRFAESGIFCGTYARAMEEVDLQLEFLESGCPQEFRQKNNLKFSSCSLQLLFMMKDLGDREAANYITALERETNMEIIYVIYRRYYALGDELEDRKFQNKGIDQRYMPRKLQRYWSEFFRQNINHDIYSDIDLDFSDTAS